MAAEAFGTAIRRDLRDEVVTIHILRCTWGRLSLPDKNKSFSLAKLARPLQYAVLAVAQQPDNLWRIGMRQALHLGDAAGGQGAGRITRRTSGMPSAAARACAARVKALVMTLTEGTPRDSVKTVSWRPHAVQEPQSAIP